jgi:hypothetical protein
MKKTYDDIRKILIQKMKEISNYDYFDAFLVTYRPSYSDKINVVAIGELEPLLDLAVKNIRLLMENIKEIDNEVSDEGLIAEITERIRNAQVLDLSTEITKEIIDHGTNSKEDIF